MRAATTFETRKCNVSYSPTKSSAGKKIIFFHIIVLDVKTEKIFVFCVRKGKERVVAEQYISSLHEFHYLNLFPFCVSAAAARRRAVETEMKRLPTPSSATGLFCFFVTIKI